MPGLSLSCHELWAAPYRPRDRRAFLKALPGEIQRVRALGGEYMEFLADPVALDDQWADPAFWAAVRLQLDDAGLGATVHLPFFWVDLTALDRHVWEGGVRSLEQALAAIEPLAPAMAAFHPSNYCTKLGLARVPAAEQPAAARLLTGRLTEATARLAKTAERHGLGPALALENLIGVPHDLFLAVVRATGIGICLDVGHAVCDGVDPVALFAEISEGPGRVVGLHLHDAVRCRPGDAERAHLPLGSGELDLPSLAAALTGFTGPVVLEALFDDQGSALAFRDALETAARNRQD